MESEKDDGFAPLDADAFFAEGVEAAGIDVESDPESDSPSEPEAGVITPKEEPAAEKPPAKADTDDDAVATEEPEAEADETGKEQPDSVISQLLPPAETPEATEEKPKLRVPLPDLVKQRQRAQAAEQALQEREQRIQELEQQLASGKETPETEAELSPRQKFIEENPDEEFLPVSVQEEQYQWEQAKQRKAAEEYAQAQRKAAEAAQAAEERLSQHQGLTKKAVDSEAAARKAHSDYEAVTRAVLDNGQLSPEVNAAIMESDDPAEALYQHCKKRIQALAAAIGIEAPAEPSQTAPAAREPEPEDGDMSDDRILETIYGEQSE